MERLYTVAAVAKLLGVGKNMIINEIHDGRLKAYKIRNMFKVKESEVEKYLKRIEYTPGDE